MRKSIALVLVLSGIYSLGLSAQDRGSSTSIEDLYLSQDVGVQFLRSQARGSSREEKIFALQSIRDMIDNGQVTADSKEVLVILDSLAGEGVYKTVLMNGAKINNFPDVRREAVNLLGKLGGVEAKKTILRVALEDREPMVLSEAVYAMGLIGKDKDSDKDMVPYLTKVLKLNNSRKSPDDNLAFACLLAIERLSGKFGGLSDPGLLSALFEVRLGNYIKTVRLKAEKVIKDMSAKS